MKLRSIFLLPSRPAGLPRLLAAVAATAFVALPAHAQWKWRDAQGRVQYSDRPPPADVRDRDILQRPATALRAPPPASAAASAAGPASAPIATTDPTLEARKRQAEGGQDKSADKAKRDDEERQARQRAENCTRAKDYARSLDSGARIARVNDKGEREVLDDAQRARESAKAREVIANDCR